jgi:signal transduction histidine kinase
VSAQLTTAILIVEDERIFAKDLQRTLIDMGYDAFAIASSAEEALEMASIRWPDLVLMDIRIKGQEDGIRTAELLQRRNAVAIIYLTAHADDATIDRAKRTEPQGYLQKPVKAADLRSMIEIVCYKQELGQVRARLRSSEQRITTITDNVPVSIAYFDRQGRVQFANRGFRELVPQRASPIGVSANTFLGDTMYQDSYSHRQHALAGETVSFILQVQRGGHSQKHEMTYVPDHDASGTVVGVYSLGYNVTEREQLIADLAQTRLDLEAILNTIPASVTSWRLDLTSRFANPAAEAQFKVSPGGARGMSIQALMGEDRYVATRPLIEKALARGRSAGDFTDAGPEGTRSYRYEEYVAELLDGVVVGFYGISMDISQLRQSHGQICELAQRLETVRDEERQRVSVILHDGIAQDLFAIKLGLSHIESLAKQRFGIDIICREVSAALAATMDKTRQLACDLRPPALGQVSLGTLIRDHARRFEAHVPFAIKVTENSEIPRLDAAQQLLFFRAAQEALTNVARHAGASMVDIVLSAEHSIIAVEVQDDGLGINVANLSKPRALGLIGLRERFEALGGGLTAEHRKPHGTTLRVFLPDADGGEKRA